MDFYDVGTQFLKASCNCVINSLCMDFTTKVALPVILLSKSIGEILNELLFFSLLSCRDIFKNRVLVIECLKTRTARTSVWRSLCCA